MIERLAHVCFRTNHYAQMSEFYGKKLGLPVKFKLRLDDGRDFGTYFDLGGTSFLELFDEELACLRWGGKPEARAPRPGAGYQHFCLQIRGLDGERARLIAAGVAATEIALGMDLSLQCWIKDPDGNDIELMEYTERSLQASGE